jgi:hypothetical protein
MRKEEAFMHLREVNFKGFFEGQGAETAEDLQIVVPDNALEEGLISWAIMQHSETVEDDRARANYVFQYDLGDQIEEGIYGLRLQCRDASGWEHRVEIAAVLASAVSTVEQIRSGRFAPLWLLSKHIHYKPLDGHMADQYHRPAFGHLSFTGVANLPHRRLFGAKVA